MCDSSRNIDDANREGATSSSPRVVVESELPIGFKEQKLESDRASDEQDRVFRLVKEHLLSHPSCGALRQVLVKNGRRNPSESTDSQAALEAFALQECSTSLQAFLPHLPLRLLHYDSGVSPFSNCESEAAVADSSVQKGCSSEEEESGSSDVIMQATLPSLRLCTVHTLMLPHARIDHGLLLRLNGEKGKLNDISSLCSDCTSLGLKTSAENVEKKHTCTSSGSFLLPPPTCQVQPSRIAPGSCYFAAAKLFEVRKEPSVQEQEKHCALFVRGSCQQDDLTGGSVLLGAHFPKWTWSPTALLRWSMMRERSVTHWLQLGFDKKRSDFCEGYFSRSTTGFVASILHHTLLSSTKKDGQSSTLISNGGSSTCSNSSLTSLIERAILEAKLSGRYCFSRVAEMRDGIPVPAVSVSPFMLAGSSSQTRFDSNGEVHLPHVQSGSEGDIRISIIPSCDTAGESAWSSIDVSTRVSGAGSITWPLLPASSSWMKLKRSVLARWRCEASFPLIGRSVAHAPAQGCSVDRLRWVCGAERIGNPSTVLVRGDVDGAPLPQSTAAYAASSWELQFPLIGKLGRALDGLAFANAVVYHHPSTTSLSFAVQYAASLGCSLVPLRGTSRRSPTSEPVHFQLEFAWTPFVWSSQTQGMSDSGKVASPRLKLVLTWGSLP